MLNEILGLSNQQVILYFLGFLRILALISVAPVFGSRAIPFQLKIFLSLLLASILLPVAKNPIPKEELFYPFLLMASTKEVFIGLFFGFNTRLIFEAFQIAGRLIGNQMGLGMAELIDPVSGAQASPIGNFFSMIALVLFLQLNGHHLIINALHDSFSIVPISNQALMSSLTGQKMLTMFSDIFKIAIKLAAPALVTFALLELSMGIIARTSPQMNIFFIALPMRLGLGFIILIVSLPVFYLFFETILSSMKNNVKELLLTF
ncbi:MAG: flagellar biosynthetic protein FliR [bacterium]